MKLYKIKIITVLVLLLFIQPVSGYDPRLVDTYHYSLHEGDQLTFNMNFSEPLITNEYEWKSGTLIVNVKADMRNIQQPYENGNPLNIDMLEYLSYKMDNELLLDNVSRYLDELFLFPVQLTTRGDLDALSLLEFYQLKVPNLDVIVNDEGNIFLESVNDGAWTIDPETGIVLNWNNVVDGIYIEIDFLELVKANSNDIYVVETVTKTETKTETVDSKLPFSFIFGIIGLFALLGYSLLDQKYNF